MTTDIQEAKVRLAELVSEAAHGADVLIAVDGVPQVRLTPVAPASTKPWDVRKYAELWKSIPRHDRGPSVTELIRQDRDSGY